VKVTNFICTKSLVAVAILNKGYQLYLFLGIEGLLVAVILAQIVTNFI